MAYIGGDIDIPLNLDGPLNLLYLAKLCLVVTLLEMHKKAFLI